jgi:hypothetical protein
LRLGEEFITKAILAHLSRKGWRILAFDYPQSGTGISLQPDDRPDYHSKNLGMVTPDVIAMKGEILLILENKPVFYEPDVEKLCAVKAGQYNDSICSVFGIKYFTIKVGIGIGDSPRERKKALLCSNAVDALLWVDRHGHVHEAHVTFDL